MEADHSVSRSSQDAAAEQLMSAWIGEMSKSPDGRLQRLGLGFGAYVQRQRKAIEGPTRQRGMG